MSNAKTTSKLTQELDAIMAKPTLEATVGKVGTFAVFNTRQVQGLRINMEKIRTYAKNSENSIQISYDNGGNTILQYSNEKEAEDALSIIDSFCL